MRSAKEMTVVPSSEHERALILSTRVGAPAGLMSVGVRNRLQVPAAELGASTAGQFLKAGTGDLMLGAVPYDRDAPSHLIAPREVIDAATSRDWLNRHAATAAAPGPWTLRAEPAREAYEDAVQTAVARIRGATGLHKVVLARTLLARSAIDIDPWWLAHRLAADPGVQTYVMPLPTAAGEAPAWWVGATPELLLSRHGAYVASAPLAGSAPRSADGKAPAEALLRSAKDQHEHRFVVEAIADLLSPFCRQLDVPATPALYATDTMWHLGTRIEGVLKDTSPDALPYNASVALAALLHPTPAVCGAPRDIAARVIGELEPLQRDVYAGAIGWTRANGDGEWHVALRCARVQATQARLYAGAGIVRDSVPAAEADETQAKFGAMLRALGLDPATLSPSLSPSPSLPSSLSLSL